MINVKKLENASYEIEFIKEGEEASKIYDQAINKLKNSIDVSGFRKGKVPKEIIEKSYQANIKEEIGNIILNQDYVDALKENEIDPIDYFSIKNFDIDSNKISLKVEVPVMPEIKLGDYKSIKVDKEKINIDDKAIDKELENLVERKSKLKEIDKNDKSINGDTVNIDFEGFIGEEAFDGGKSEGHDLKLGSDSFIKGFEEQVENRVVGDEFDVNVTFPEEYHSEDLKGKEATFKVKVNSIKRPEKMELNDDFAKEFELETLDELKDKTKKDLESREENRINNETMNKVVEEVVKTANFTTPEALVNREIDMQINQFAQQLRQQGLDIDKYFNMTGQSMDAMKETLRESSETRVKTDLVLAEISKLENIEVSEDELDEKIVDLSKSYGMEKDQLIEELKKAGNYENFKSSINYETKMKKTIDYLVDLATK